LRIPGGDFDGVDASRGGETKATSSAVLQILEYASDQSYFPDLLAALPVLGVDGSLAFFTSFEADPTLAGAVGNVSAKTGTYATGDENGILLKGSSMAGFVSAKSGRNLMFSLIVNNVQLGTDIEDLLLVSEDQATISAIVWRDY